MRNSRRGCTARGAARSAPPRARLRPHPPGAQAPGRDAAAAVGGVRPGQPAGLQVHELLHQVPRVGGAPEALHAPGPRRPATSSSPTTPARRVPIIDAATGEIQRGADLRGDAGRVELHLRLRHGRADRRRLGRLAHRRAGVHRRRAAADRARPATRADRAARPLRARRRPSGRGVLRPLQRRRAPGTARSSAGQAEGRERGARGREVDPGAPAQPPLLQPGRAQRRHRASCRRAEHSAPSRSCPAAGARPSSAWTSPRCGRCRQRACPSCASSARG